ncbi:MAG TPA: class I SAM-dependent RNA methyltransferase [Terracidiphilus sp.]|jgi:23S rRNA (uracil1939-C5)-methyltransferase|nr:class I SAM-dependent RNA methyltransferase [Terracidiphilus sp.]
MRNRRQIRAPRPAAKAAPRAERLVQIEKPIYGGSFLARDEGKAVFVPLVLPGEQARVQVVEEKAKRGYAKAELAELVTQALERVTPRCPHFGPCGGCNYQHATYEAQLRIKQQVLRETLARGGVIPPDEIAVLSREPWQYRNRIRVAFDAEGNPGYRGRRSHQVVPIRECPIAAPVLVDAALAAAQVFRKLAARNRPAELALFCDADGTSLLASVFAGAATREPILDSLLREIRNLKGAELVEQRGDDTRTIAQEGAASLAYRAGGFHYRVDHGAFFQVNRWLIDPLLQQVAAKYEGKLAWDLFAGVGLFARQLAGRFERVIAVESAPAAGSALAANLAGSAGEPIAMAAFDFLRRNASGPRPDLIVVDPPRTGLGPEIVAMAGRIAAPTLAYVSCDPATLARDLRGLLEDGYAIESVTLVDLFPQTFHLESVVHLRRS